MNALVPQAQPGSASSSNSYRDATALVAELTKILQLVAPQSMGPEDRAAWTLSAADALEGIRPEEVGKVSAEVRRSITHHNKIVPEIARLVAEHRKRATNVQAGPDGPCSCGAGTAAKFRSDIHWTKKDGRSEIGWCD